MRLSDFEKNDEKDKIEQVKQQVEEIQLVLDEKIIPNKNHIIFEYNLVERTISVAKFKPFDTLITWEEALKQYNSKKVIIKDIGDIKTKTKSEILKKENCVYVHALNETNAIKKLKRDFKHIITWL